MVQFSQIAVALIHTMLGLFVLRSRSASVVNRAFAAQSLLFAGWVLGLSGLHSNATVSQSFPVTFAFASLIPVGFLLFSHYYPGATSWSCPLIIKGVFVIGGAFALLSLGTDLIVYDAELGADGLKRKTGALYPPFAVYFIATWCAGLWIFAKKWRSSRGLARAQYHYLGAGLIGGSLGGISTNLLLPLWTGNSTYSWVGPYFTLVYVGFVAHAIIRHRLMDLRLFIHRGLTIGLASILSAIPACLLLGIFWPRLLTTLEPAELALLLVTVAVVTVLIPATRDVAGRLLDRYLYRTHANYQRTVREASQVLTRVLDLDKLLAFLSSTVVRSTGTVGVAIYLLDQDVFRCAIAEKSRDVGRFEAPQEAPIEVVAVLRADREPILIDDMAPERGATTVALHEHLGRVDWSLLLPVISEDMLIAIIAVGPKLSGDSFYQQDLDLLMTLANQAGIAVKNAQLYAAMLMANEYLENIVATLESGVVAINASGNVTIFNRAAEKLTGLSANNTRASTTLPPCLAAPLFATLNDGERRNQPEIDLPAANEVADGSITRPVICTTSPVRNPAGAVVGAVAVFSDLTPLKELEVERRNAERLAYFQALASGIAHEIKNPLVAIKTFTQLLPRRHDDKRFLEEFGRISTREIERMQRIVDRLSTLSRPTGGPREPIDLRHPLGNAVEFMQPTLQEKGLGFSISMPAQPCTIVGTSAELEQLFLNLLLNAYEATPSGGMVTVELAYTNSQILVTVSDTGPGISPELLEKIFEPFFSTKGRGSGLGLAISSGIAQRHGGCLRAANQSTCGAVFCVEFPAMSASPVVA